MVEANTIRFFVPGVPKPAGSKRPIKTKGGRVFLKDMSGAAGEDWTAKVAHEAKLAMGERVPLDCPLRIMAHFWFQRPKRHYRTGRHSNVLRDDASDYCDVMPDIDKLVRRAMDAMTGIVFVDDRQVVELESGKYYANSAGGPMARIEIADVITGVSGGE